MLVGDEVATRRTIFHDNRVWVENAKRFLDQRIVGIVLAVEMDRKRVAVLAGGDERPGVPAKLLVTGRKPGFGTYDARRPGSTQLLIVFGHHEPKAGRHAVG